MRSRSWTDNDLKAAIPDSTSIRAVLIKLGLRPSGGNYVLVKRRIKELELNTDHFLGYGWNVGLKFVPNLPRPLSEILFRNGTYQSHKLKLRLFKEGYKEVKCELCGWNKKAADGRIPLELDHVNGDRMDNRLENLRILCPNCHSLQPTHRGRNRVK